MVLLKQIPRKYYLPLISAGLLLFLALSALVIDVPLSRWASSDEVAARDQTTSLGELLQLCRIFGVADTVILMALLFGLCGKRQLLMRVLLSLLVVGAIVQPVKMIVGRERPNTRNHRSFPSGDTATAFVLPQSFSGLPGYSAAATVVATVVGSSRVFFKDHYPSDVLAGAAVGLLAGVIGCWLVGKLRRRYRWLPSQQMILWATVIFLGFELLKAAAGGHHRHIIQFVTWYGPAMALYLCHSRLRKVYGRRKSGSFLTAYPDLYYMVKRGLIGCVALGGLLMVVPWFWGGDGLRAPAFSLGLLLVVYAVIERRQLMCGRNTAVIADSVALLYVCQIYAVGYLLGVL